MNKPAKGGNIVRSGEFACPQSFFPIAIVTAEEHSRYLHFVLSHGTECLPSHAFACTTSDHGSIIRITLRTWIGHPLRLATYETWPVLLDIVQRTRAGYEELCGYACVRDSSRAAPYHYMLFVLHVLHSCRCWSRGRARVTRNCAGMLAHCGSRGLLP